VVSAPTASHWLGEWVGPRAYLDEVVTSKNLVPAGRRIPVV